MARGRRTMWLLGNLVISLACAVVAYPPIWFAGWLGLRDASLEPISAGGYFVALLLSAMMWPIYMAILARVSATRPDRFRRWAVGLCPLLGAVPPGIIFVNVPEYQAAVLAYVLLGFTVRPLDAGTTPGRARPAGPRRDIATP